MLKKYKHLSLKEREIIYALREQGKSFRYIAKVLNRNHRTIAREYKRNRYAGKPYIPCKAHEIANKRAINQRTKAPLKSLHTYMHVIDKLRNNKWSPEQISDRLKVFYPKIYISTEAIYLYIYGKGKKHKLWEYLPNRRKKRKKTKRGVNKAKFKSPIPYAVSIDKRSTRAERRTQVGHIETDNMESGRGYRAALSVESERRTRYTILTKMKDKTAISKEKALTKSIKLLKSFQKSHKPIIRSITSDNGRENTKHIEISREHDINWYFCRAYHAWEKGTVERTIKEIRRYIPKGDNIGKYTREQVQYIENQLNNRPMKCLGWRTPAEAMEEEANKYKFRRYKKQKELVVTNSSKWGTST